MTNKTYELIEIMRLENPDILCLQETKRTTSSARFDVDGYTIIEKLSSDKKNHNGLIMAYKNKFKESTRITILSDFIIQIQLEDEENEKIYVTNVYNPNEGPERKNTLEIIKRNLRSNKKVIISGDWNYDKKELKESLEKTDVPSFYANTYVQGSRCVDGIETSRVIDYSITNDKEMIIDEKYLKKYKISDHYAVKTKLELKIKTDIAKDKIIFDRNRIRNT